MKTKLGLILMVPALLTGLAAASSQPSLGIVVTNYQVVLFWNANTGGTNGVLQGCDQLNLASLTTVTDAVPFNYSPWSAVSVSQSSSARFFRLSLVPPTADGMALIPAGSFTMGDTLDGENDAVPTNIYVSAFYMDTNLVSYGEWLTVYNASFILGYGYSGAGPYVGKATNYPVEHVEWYDMVKWCNARSQLAGLTPVYYTDVFLTSVYTNGQVVNPHVNWSANGYRLPTEAEWEKAARGGLATNRFPWGMTISESQANYYSTNLYFYDLGPYTGYNTNFVDTGQLPLSYTSPVGYFAPNGYGLNDVAGNLLEWCWDWYGTLYGQPTTNNPTGPSMGAYRVERGGWCGGDAYGARCASRNIGSPASAGAIGFRCVRGP